MSLLACYGGSFDPVHLGHLAVARTVRDALAAEVALVPAADPPHKDATHAGAARRGRMLELAIAGEPGLCIDPLEFERDGPSYTIDTLRMVRARQGPHRPVAWVVGGDSLLQLDAWYRWRELFAHGHVLAVARPGSPLGPEDIAARAPAVACEIGSRRRPAEALADTPAGGFAVLELPRLRHESSTEVRRRIAAGGDWESLLPAPVAGFVREHRLYGYRAATGPSL
ncbi:nicotinate-nucleotide adenylyltransferase [Luteimonas sp. MC1750]|uniref:nicotinate-nucleotide adenylyltransferase n=1 Tax=Luteimonas sp. MC1750 TaxID=2799326 RepID=UPI0018F0F83B|nr:nicotinate-nucleotide adenylyltransferase [Luteimonas sp. MC1750]MBJ6984822.1 nicotinate-nucleotide adenylyltransferase [Luteimonas sp. MC1750]QQO07083.1 nicotinate-nucleotide adenylyltransferase [Luteimonas sp. MC1750]